MKETELFEPVKQYLETQGYQVNAEVRDCDITASRGDELIVVELKVSANMQLLVQATDRQRIADSVYVAIPEGAHKHKYFLGIKRVLKRLELGLLLVKFSPLGAHVNKIFDPLPAQRRKQPRKRRAVIKEIAERSKDYNTGGSSRTRIVTAYREKAILIATGLEILGPSKPKTLRDLGSGDKTTSILSNNHYGWFQRVERGVYQVTEQGVADVRHFKELHSLSQALVAEHLASKSDKESVKKTARKKKPRRKAGS